MIIWLASYPKNGNTLLRSMLSAYFFTADGKFNFDTIKNIKQFPAFKLFKYGPKVNTPESLPLKIKEKLEVSLKKEMKELEYL